MGTKQETAANSAAQIRLVCNWFGGSPTSELHRLPNQHTQTMSINHCRNCIGSHRTTGAQATGQLGSREEVANNYLSSHISRSRRSFAEADSRADEGAPLPLRRYEVALMISPAQTQPKLQFPGVTCLRRCEFALRVPREATGATVSSLRLGKSR